MKHLVLRFWGNDNFPSTAVPFEIKSMEKQKKKRSPADLLFLKGIFLDDNDEEQKVENV